MSKFRKIFALFTVVASLLIYTDVAAATYNEGALVKKASSTTVYFVGANNGLYTFPSQVEFFSRYENFDAVQTVSDADFAAFHLAGTMGVRPGTWMVKVTDFAETYAVESGNAIRHVSSETIAASLFGSNWNQWIKDINPNTFAATYRTGTAISAVNQFPAGHLIKVDGTKYYIEGSKRRPFASESAFTANMFRNEFVHEVTAGAVSAFSIGTSVTGLETTLLDYPTGGGNPVISGDITFSLASSTPASMTVPDGAGNFKMTAVNVTNGASTAVNLTGVTIKRYGVSSDTIIDGVKVLDSNNNRHGGTVSFYNGYSTISFASDPIALPAGQTTTIYLAADIVAAGNNNGTLALGIESATGITVSGGTVRGTFPIRGNEMSIIDGASLLGTAKVGVVGNYTQTLDVGDKDEVIAQFKIFEVTNEQIAIDRIVLTNRGTATTNDIANIRIFNESTGALIGSVASLSINNQAVVTTTGLSMAEGSTVTMTVKADITGGTSRTLQLVVEQAEDITLRGLETGVSFLPTADSSNDTTFPMGDKVTSTSADISLHNINQGTQSLGLSPSSPSNKVAAGSNQVIGTYDFTAAGEATEVRVIYVGYATDGTAGSTRTLDTAGLWGTNNDSIASSVSNVEVPTGSIAADKYYVVKYTLSPYLTIPAGQTKQVKLVAQLNETDYPTNTRIKGLINGWEVKLLSSNLNQTNGSTITGSGTDPHGSGVPANTLSVEDSSMNIAIDNSLPSTTIVTGSTGAPIAQFVLSTAAAEAANVSNITIGTRGAGNTFPDGAGGTCIDTNAFCGNKISNVMLYKWSGSAWVKIGDTQSTPSNSPTFSVSGELNLAANSSVQIRVIGTIASSGVSDAASLRLTAAATGVAMPSNKSLTANATDLQIMTMSTTGGLLSFSYDPTSAASSSLVVSSQTMVNLADFKFTSNLVEGSKINKIVMGGLNFDKNITRVYLYDGATKIGEQPLQYNSTSARYEASFAGLNVEVAKGGSKVLTVKGDAAAIQALATNSDNTRFIAPVIFDIDSVGLVSNLSQEVAGTLTAADTFLPNGTQSSVVGQFIYSTGATAGVTYPTYGITVNAADFNGGTVIFNDNDATTTWSSAYRISRLGLADNTSTTANVNFEVGDLVFVADTVDTDGAGSADTTSANFAVVTTAVSSGAALSGLVTAPTIGDTAYGTAGVYAINLTENAAGTAGALYTNAKHAIRVHRADDVVPVMTSTMSNTTLAPQANQMIGKYSIKAEGGRDLTMTQITFTISGSNGPFTPWDGDLAASCTEGTITQCKVTGYVLKDSNDQQIAATLTADAGSSTVQFALATPITITQGQSKEFRLYANTSNIKMDGASNPTAPSPVQSNVTLSSRLEGYQGPFPTAAGPVSYGYISAFDNSTTVNSTFSNTLPVLGAVATY